MSNKVNKSLTSFIEKNRSRLDESLVSLRFMKQIDIFMHLTNKTQKELAADLDTSPAFISQLMSGSKRINISFINKFEKKYNLEFKIELQRKNFGYTVMDSNAVLQLKTNSDYIDSNEVVFVNDSETIYILKAGALID